jgi:acyl carrier protein
MNSKIDTILIDILGCKRNEIKLESNLKEDFLADSIDMIEIMIDLEVNFDISISDKEGQTLITVQDCHELVKAKLEDKKGK